MPQRTVYLVDDDATVIASLTMLLELNGYRVQPFQSPERFLTSKLFDRPACAVLDLKMPGMNGIEVQKHLFRKGENIPVIFISGHGNLETAVEAMREGASDFLVKPFKTADFLFRIDRCIQKDWDEFESCAVREKLQERFNRLSPREVETYDLLVAGMSVKKVGMHLEISPRTAEKHRHNVLRKMGVDSVVELVHTAIFLGRTVV